MQPFESKETIGQFYSLFFRITPQMIMTGVSPVTLLMGLHLRSRLDRLFPDLSDKAQTQQSKQAQHHDSTKPLKTFKSGDAYTQKTFLPLLLYGVQAECIYESLGLCHTMLGYSQVMLFSNTLM